jgi:hypothetical protein
MTGPYGASVDCWRGKKGRFEGNLLRILLMVAVEGLHGGLYITQVIEGGRVGRFLMVVSELEDPDGGEYENNGNHGQQLDKGEPLAAEHAPDPVQHEILPFS